MSETPREETRHSYVYRYEPCPISTAHPAQGVPRPKVLVYTWYRTALTLPGTVYTVYCCVCYRRLRTRYQARLPYRYVQ
jgi:hypothetical protein